MRAVKLGLVSQFVGPQVCWAAQASESESDFGDGIAAALDRAGSVYGFLDKKERAAVPILSTQCKQAANEAERLLRRRRAAEVHDLLRATELSAQLDAVKKARELKKIGIDWEARDEITGKTLQEHILDLIARSVDDWGPTNILRHDLILLLSYE